MQIPWGVITSTGRRKIRPPRPVSETTESGAPVLQLLIDSGHKADTFLSTLAPIRSLGPGVFPDCFSQKDRDIGNKFQQFIKLTG